MVFVSPFKGVLYNPDKVKDLAKVVAPPYDVISPQAKQKYLEGHDYNVIRLILPDEYTQAAESFKDWLDKGILKEDSQPSIYIYEQEYSIKGDLKKRLGFMAAMKLEEYETGKVLPHEKTFPKPKQDRLELLRACRANFSQVFGLYPDEGKVIRECLDLETKSEPLIHIVDDFGETHKLWKVTSKESLERITKGMVDKPVFIADGHHRYGAALAYRNEMRTKYPPRQSGAGEKPWNLVMMCFVDIDDPGLTILPTHRVVRGIDTASLDEKISPFFKMETISQKEKLFKEMESRGRAAHVLGMYTAGDFRLLTLKDEKVMQEMVKEEKPLEWKRLDVTILHSLLLEHILGIKAEAYKEGGPIAYLKDPQEVIDLIDRKEFELAIFLNPTRLSQVKSIARAREMMPQKSTYFYPKLLSGLVLRKI